MSVRCLVCGAMTPSNELHVCVAQAAMTEADALRAEVARLAAERDRLRALVREAAEVGRGAAVELLRAAQGEPGYGYFPGGDPRCFSPDHECSTEEERAAHAKDCAAWERGEQTHSVEHGCKLVAEGEISVLVTPSGYGLGTYQYDDERVMAQYEAMSALLARLEAEGGR